MELPEAKRIMDVSRITETESNSEFFIKVENILIFQAKAHL